MNDLFSAWLLDLAQAAATHNEERWDLAVATLSDWLRDHDDEHNGNWFASLRLGEANSLIAPHEERCPTIYRTTVSLEWPGEPKSQLRLSYVEISGRPPVLSMWSLSRPLAEGEAQHGN